MIEMQVDSEYFRAMKGQEQSFNLIHQAKENKEAKR